MSKTHTCEKLVEIATRYRNRSHERGIELVVVVTDEEGRFVAVSSTEDPTRTAAILRAALEGAEHKAHAYAGVIEKDPTS